MQKHCCGTGEQVRLECQEQSDQSQIKSTEFEAKCIDATIARPFEAIRAISGEIRDELAAIKDCPEPCDDGMVNISLPSRQTKKLPCPLLTPDCHYGERMEQELDRHIIGVMTDIGVPLRHIENFPDRREMEETAEASRWPVRGFLIFTGDSGMGKSFDAALVLYEYLKSRVSNHFDRGSWEAAKKTRSSVIWSTAMDIAEDRKTAAQAKHERLAVIDDLGSESDTPEGQAAIRGVLMKRYDMKLPTIVTTALTMVDIDIRYGSRIANRLTEDVGNGGSIIDCRSFSMHSSTLLFMAAEGRQNS